MIEVGRTYLASSAFCYDPHDATYIPGAFYRVLTLSFDPARDEYLCLVLDCGDVVRLPAVVLTGDRRLA